MQLLKMKKEKLKGLRVLSIYFYLAACFYLLTAFIFLPYFFLGAPFFIKFIDALFNISTTLMLDSLLIPFFNINDSFLILRISLVILALFFILVGIYISQQKYWAKIIAILFSIASLFTIIYFPSSLTRNSFTFLHLIVNFLILYYLFFKVK